jgi:formylglycine-generating enzyme required for sulfatase activity
MHRQHRARALLAAMLGLGAAGCTLDFQECRIPGACGPARCEGLETCGASESCCASIAVAAGAFLRGHDNSEQGEQPASSGTAVQGWVAAGAPATVSAFRLDTYPVTVGRFRQFVDAYDGYRRDNPAPGAAAHPRIDDTGWEASWSLALDEETLIAGVASCQESTWRNDSNGGEKLPMNCLNWYEAFAFCAWDGGRLPTENEWRYVASGVGQQRAFPWSDPPGSLLIDDNRAIYDDAPLMPVDERPLGRGSLGHYALSGHVREWVFDYLPVPVTSYPPSCDDCLATPEPTSDRMRLGGAYVTDAARLRTMYRSGSPPQVRQPYFGVRCARDPL